MPTPDRTPEAMTRVVKDMSDLQLSYVLASVVGALAKMSDDVVNAQSPLDAQGCLLRLQKSIQTNLPRAAAITKIVIDRFEASK